MTVPEFTPKSPPAVTADTQARRLLREKGTESPLRFRALMGSAAWSRLRKSVRQRFSREIGQGQTVGYTGVITETRLSVAGICLSQLCRIIGAPLPLERCGGGMAANVTVTGDTAGNGQFWTRSYCRKRGFPQVIHSSKRFAGPTGLEEYIGFGIGMSLRVSENNGGIVFTSTGFFLHFAGLRLPLPILLVPLQVEVRHDDLGDDFFAFTLRVETPLAGELIHQRAVFRDMNCGSLQTFH